MKRSIFIFLSLLLAIGSRADNLIKHITTFSGTDYVRVVIDASPASSSAYKVVIKSARDGKILWQGPVKPIRLNSATVKQLSFTINKLKPELWTPANPFLYELTLQQYNGKKLSGQVKQRIGFRSITTKDGQIVFNGKPLFLRGIAINPPGRGIPSALEKSRDFAIDYVKFMKSINVNIIRIPNDENWYNVCDELGMLVFGGNYSGIVNGEKPPVNYDKALDWYEHKEFAEIAHHPSLVVYAMTNETPFQGKEVAAWEKFLSYAASKLKQWDETRLYIANAGYGYGKAGDICDIHRYWGWYYSSPFTFLHIRNNTDIIPIPKKVQPITFTECVGNYTGPDGRYNLTPSHKNPSSQLAWTGHEREDLQAHLADEHQGLTLRNATELFRQLRVINPELSGVFPFTILFYNWDTITKFADMKPKPVTEQVRLSYQPVLLSWECWTPHIYVGTSVKAIAHIVNDDNGFHDLTKAKLVYQIYDKTKAVVVQDSIKLADVPYYKSAEQTLNIKVPENLISGDYQLYGRIISNGRQVSENYFNLFVADRHYADAIPPLTSNLILYDTKGDTKKALKKLNVQFRDVSDPGTIPSGSLLLIGENSADDALKANAKAIKDFIAKGGRVISLRQDASYLPNLNSVLKSSITNYTINIDDPVYPVSAIPPRNGYYVNPERTDHPVFAGITRENLKVWSDYTGWDEKQKGFPAIYPVTDGFTLTNKDDIANTAVLGNYSSGLQGIALAEQFIGNGSILLCGFDLANRAGLDPVADKLLLNMISYAATTEGHYCHQIITSPIIWGEYETEKGIVTDIYSGFLVNATPRLTDAYKKKGIVITKEGYQLAGGKRVEFNTRPGLQYVANGRRPFGPYTQTFGGQPKLTADSTSNSGTGKFWCRIPEADNMASTVVWNPANEELKLSIKINDLPEVTKSIPPGEKVTINCPVNAAEVSMSYQGDRRLVILETAFKRSGN